MAQQQAARLASRMQRELKMLASDPPPGVCAWPLHSHLLTRLQAQIQGPQGTVYAGGIFKLDIEVPDRYPFEPPSIRFLTRVYHPNVDSGGRICLDILNAPPKGAWRPSLNLSTLLASIGLLLAEPNPDDGLMVDITAEYKHDRPTFDTKARRWTELYATNDGLKQTGALDDLQQAESLKEKGFPLPEPMQKKHHSRMNVIQEQANEVIDNPGNGTVGPRKKRSLEGDLEDQASPVPIKGKDYLKENKISDPKDETWFVYTKINDSKERNLSLQSDPKRVNASLPSKDPDSQEQRKMMGIEKENQTPNKCLDSLPLVSKMNCYKPSQGCDDNMVISAPQVMETFGEGMPVSTGEVPSRSKSLKLSRTRLDMQSSKMQQTNTPRSNEKPSRQCEEVPQCNEKTSSQINCHVVVKDAQTLLPAENDYDMNTATKKLQMTSTGKARNYEDELPTIIVSDSGSDDEDSEDFPLSLTQRSFICKRKANFKLR